ncbi:MAG: hypothetical protein K0R26_1617 [Bacteroidota bacterium]|jgi:hypothetical protein|nr:hypothetical protein [Bacteroidota bacterium]
MRGVIQFILKHPVRLFCICIFAMNLTIALVYKNSGSPNTHKHTTLYGGDAQGYYEYLDWAFNGKNINYESGYSYPRGENRILKYTFGTAAFQLPFSLISSALESKHLSDSAFSFTDDLLINIGASFYLALALYLLFRLLGKFSLSKRSRVLAVITMYGATNLLYYSAIENMMSHLYSFLSISGYVFYTIQYTDSKDRKHFLYSLIFLFLIIAIRPFNVIIVFPFLVYLFAKSKTISKLIYSVMTIILAGTIQIILWRFQCGEWTIASYDGEGFYWFDPQFKNVLFSFRKGLFVYSPVLILSVFGLLFMPGKKSSHIAVIFSLLIFTYTVSCWWHWPYGDSFGHRAFIDVYPFLALGLASTFEYFKNKGLKTGIGVFVIFCSVITLFQSWQYGNFILAPEYMTFGKYKATFLQTNDSITRALGGPKDIFPYKARYDLIFDSLMDMDLSTREYSEALVFKDHPKGHRKCYLDISFVKEEIISGGSFDARLLFQTADTVTEQTTYRGCCLNEGSADYLKPNTKSYSFQLDFQRLKQTEKLTVFFTNPRLKPFRIKHVKVKVYYIQ